MNIQPFEFNLFGELTYLLWDPETKESAVVDPGMSNEPERKLFTDFVEKHGLKIKYLLYTHLHIDHTFGHEFIKERYGVSAMAHPADAPLGAMRGKQAAQFRLRMPELQPLAIDEPLHDGQKLTLGNENITVIHVPGHSQGSVAYYCPESGFVLTGDALFKSSIGRTDLPGGNHRQLIESIINNLMTLPPQTVVYPGHGEPTTIRQEARDNIFLR